MNNSLKDTYWLNKALHLAKKAEQIGEVPVGAVIVKEGKLISWGKNLRESMNSPLAHAEILAIHRASQKLRAWRLTGCTLYVTLEPCLMCAGAIVQSRLDRVIFGALDPKGGAVVSKFQMLNNGSLNHQCEVFHIDSPHCGQILTNFFKLKRKKYS